MDEAVANHYLDIGCSREVLEDQEIVEVLSDEHSRFTGIVIATTR